MSLISSIVHPLLTLGGQALAIGVAIGLVVLAVRSFTPRRMSTPLIAGYVLSAFALVLTVVNLVGATSLLNRARANSVGARAGLEHCFVETNATSRLPFVDWVKRQLPRDSVYELSGYTGQPDAWCVTLAFLPLLPAGPGGQPHWVVTFGYVPPSIAARIAAHDPTVRVFAPGFVRAPTRTR